MIYDLQRRSVAKEWARYAPDVKAFRQAVKDAVCPECQWGLAARIGNRKVHHWAHKPRGPHGCEASAKETEWHLAIKDACERNGYDLEVASGPFRYDAASRDGSRDFDVVEAVNTNSPKNHDKAVFLAGQGKRQLWVFNMERACSRGYEKADWRALAEHVTALRGDVWWLDASREAVWAGSRPCHDEVTAIELAAAMLAASVGADASEVHARALKSVEDKILAAERFEEARRQADKRKEWYAGLSFVEAIEWRAKKNSASTIGDIARIAHDEFDRLNAKKLIRDGMPMTRQELEELFPVERQMPSYASVRNMAPRNWVKANGGVA